MFVFLSTLFTIALLMRLQEAEDEKKVIFSIAEMNFVFFVNSVLRASFALQPDHARHRLTCVHAITQAIKKWGEIKCAKAYGFFSGSKAFFLLLF